MKTLQSPFGEVHYDPERVVRFPEGWIGFESLRDFVVVPNKQPDSPLFCLLSIDRPHILFTLINPNLFFPDYEVEPDASVYERLGIKAESSKFIMTTVTSHEDGTLTVNLLAPVVYTPETDRAVQIVLDGSGYSARTPVPLKNA